MTFLRRTHSSHRGQALAEFALVLPILVLLLVLAIDFGRAFFGWVSLTNAARIGANYAGYTPNLDTDPVQRSEFEDLVTSHVTGCNFDPTTLDDDPEFNDTNADGKDNGWGDHVTVSIRCELDLLTPLASAILGQQVPMAAEAVFPIREGTFSGPGGGGTPPDPPCTLATVPDLENRTLAGAKSKWEGETFLPERLTRSPTEATDDWLVTQPITFTPDAEVGDCVDPSGQSVHLTTVAPPPCPAGQAQVPDLIGDTVAAAKTEWAASFSGAFKPNNAVDSKHVLTQVTNPTTSPPINGCLAVNAEVTVTWGDLPPSPCDVPNMIGLSEAGARTAWQDAGFTPAKLTVKKQGNSPDTVFQQSPTHPGTVSCEVNGEVRLD